MFVNFSASFCTAIVPYILLWIMRHRNPDYYYVAAKCMFVAARKYLFKQTVFLTFTFRKRMPCLQRVYAASCQIGRDVCSMRDFCSNKINFASSKLPLVFAASQFLSKFAAAEATASLPLQSWLCRCKAGFCLPAVLAAAELK